MKRIRPGTDPYWVIIGGGVEDSDATREDALLREVHEEIAGAAEIMRLFHQLENPKGETEVLLPRQHHALELRRQDRPRVPAGRPRRVHPRRSPSPPKPSPT
ncbi:NUDIX domain-containing protein [Streptomyces sp. MCA2]|uniref:NUDIX domain-containing protein n=1 Tax=Streptomyces sp. MCA2 TaxID=2944805 RepID=UPI002021A2B1|nr:NUDIX domain-containing protein [Streptomyces sp. MCA2]MCL7493183.1 NUDIX domain-containing protein [Streptomyces sp. MCA2]